MSAEEAGTPDSSSLRLAAEELGRHHDVRQGKAEPLAAWRNIDAMSGWLVEARKAALEASPETAKAAEWLLDNDYQVHRAIRQVARDLPPHFYRRLPALEDRGLPRVFAAAHELLKVTRLQISLDSAVEFMRGYQKKERLLIAELWAFPTMLRLACLEILVVGFSRMFPEVEAPFRPSTYATSGNSFDDIERVARAIANLALIASIPWDEFFDRASCVEEILSGDPAEVYTRMDFVTRDRYRRAVEEIADGSGATECDVAELAVEKAAEAAELDSAARHVGYWLIGPGLGALESAVGYVAPRRVALRRSLLKRAGILYVGALLLLELIALVVPAAYMAAVGARPLAWAVYLLVSIIPASILAVTIVHSVVTRITSPRVLPKLDFDKGIAADCRTLVVVPVIVGSTAAVPDILERLEAHRLANPDPSLQFAILSDLADAPSERVPGDEEIEAALRQGIERLNTRHGDGTHGPFHLLHRTRTYNPREDCWMGWERKRGKLEQLNHFLLGESASAFAIHVGNPDGLTGIRFIVTVDADTRLPAGSVSRLAGTLAHPLNRARFDPATGEIVSGYSIIQPRTEVSPESGNRSLFARWYTGDTAIDIYSRAVSDVYQDLFGEGIFVGKGIYDLAAFHRCVDGKIPDNAILSHDLFEGLLGRAGLATDIVLYENFPGSYLEYLRRWHRWVRGDWQLVPWLLPRVPGPNGTKLPNPFSGIDRWKIVDNLRRSLLAPGLLLFVLAGWLLLPGSPWVWTLLAALAPAAYLFTDLISGFAAGRRRGSIRGLFAQIADQAGRWFLAIVFLPREAGTALHAITTVFWRLSVSRKHLLEWTSAADVARRLKDQTSRIGIWKRMWPGPVFALAAGGVIVALRPSALPAAAPFLLLWVLSAEVAVFIGRPLRPAEPPLDTEDRNFLRKIARRTWLYFETFAGPEDHWLPPDNYQEDPFEEIGHRTSPTNIGMMLTSSLTAWDLGHIGSPELAARLGNAFEAMHMLEQHRGHFLNWYDTRALTPLEPRYVSTVDSGNLAVCLVAVAGGCREVAAAPMFPTARFDGLIDVIGIIRDDASDVPGDLAAPMLSEIDAIQHLIEEARDDPPSWGRALTALWDRIDGTASDGFAQTIGALEAEAPAALRALSRWTERLAAQIHSMKRDFDQLLPWVSILAGAPPEASALAESLRPLLSPVLSLDRLTQNASESRRLLEGARADGQIADDWAKALASALDMGLRNQEGLAALLYELAERASSLAYAMDFAPLYDRERRLFHIGYNVSSDHLDPHHYDLLATEARIASYFAIAKGDAPSEHWFFLGRPLTRAAGGIALLSWNGSMFEYLMAPIFLRSGPETLVGESERVAVDIQRQYARRFAVPWGISESAFALRDPEHRYRYQAFGSPGLGLKRDLGKDLVVAPYASALGLLAQPGAAVDNLRRLADLGAIGLYGYFEALDFTAGRVEPRQAFTPVRAYMAHHQGMILAAIANALFDDIFVRRFRADPKMRTVDLLLSERVPREVPSEIERIHERQAPPQVVAALPALRSWQPAQAGFPQLHALGNGRMASWISESGGGGLAWRHRALTRFGADATQDHQGFWIYVSDEESGALWSAARQPTGAVPQEYQVTFHPHMAEFHRRDDGIAIRTEIGVVAAEDVEIRRLTLVNESARPRVLKLTSYGEVVLSPPMDDERHPAFSKLFVRSEFRPRSHGLLFTRRPRRPNEAPPVLVNRLILPPQVALLGYETDRRAFLGRNGDFRRPKALERGLSGTEGWTLDPIMAFQARVELDPHASCEVSFVTVVAGSREAALELAERYSTPASLGWAFDDAAMAAAREAQEIGIDPEQLPHLQSLVSLLVYSHPALRAGDAVRRANRLGQPHLWGLGLSGDRPILLLKAGEGEEPNLLRLLIAGHRLWIRRGIEVDLVVLKTTASSYLEPTRDQIVAQLTAHGAREYLGRKGGIHLVSVDQMGPETARLLESVAHVVLDDRHGSLAQQLAGVQPTVRDIPRLQPSRSPAREDAPVPEPDEELLFANGIGGFTPDGSEYVMTLGPEACTPAPWSNVLANDGFGTLVTEAGGGFTWAVNSGENRLTPWSNDPVEDRPGEVLYLRDEETGRVWTPTPYAAGEARTQVRHGIGYSRWRQQSNGLDQDLLLFVPPSDPVKVARLRLRNLTDRQRRVTATYYAEWQLGALPSVSRPAVVVDYDPDARAILARNPWNPDFAERQAFLTASLDPHSLTLDRFEFLGREGDPRRPAGLGRWGLAGNVSAAVDPCGAYQVHIDLEPEGECEIVFALGQGADRREAEALARRWRDPAEAAAGLKAVEEHWRTLLAIDVATPDRAFDVMMNRWLLYQSISSRICARAGFYQAGGAIGFRDQLQDMLAVLHVDPPRVRAHILACAAHQFEEGDVMHWWHPPTDRGVRTRCSDDLLWLPFVVAAYVRATGDRSILSESVPFLRAPPLAAEEGDRYARFDVSPVSGELFDHCVRAIEHGTTRGVHGLPLIGSGDWNDGMDRIGEKGRGESVWLAWFSIVTLEAFGEVARAHGREDLASDWAGQVREIRAAAEEHGWDGEWYRRAYDDEGEPWGSAANDECRIDSISQSWAVLAGADPDRTAQALAAATRELVRTEDRLVRLLTPPFDATSREPGYIKAYPPGVRENGGQYTHAAAWLGFAFARLGDGDRAYGLFDLINPIHLARDAMAAERYRDEPYVIAADVADGGVLTGRGGWSWYTGSSAWLWRLGLEAILGIRQEEGGVSVSPCLPRDWGGCEVSLRRGGGTLHIRIDDPDRLGSGAVELTVNGEPWSGSRIPYPEDGATCEVTARIRPAPAQAEGRRGQAR